MLKGWYRKDIQLKIELIRYWRFIMGDNEKVCELGGLKYQLRSGHYMDEIMMKGSYFEPWTVRWIKRFVDSDSIAVDVGANFDMNISLLKRKRVWAIQIPEILNLIFS